MASRTFYKDVFECEDAKVELELTDDTEIIEVRITINDTSQMILTPVQFKSMNALFKRASFRLED